MLFIKILGFTLLGIGVLLVFASRWAVTRFELDKNTKCDFENEITEEELKLYKYNKAVVNLKMLGMLVSLPGIAIVLYVFK